MVDYLATNLQFAVKAFPKNQNWGQLDRSFWKWKISLFFKFFIKTHHLRAYHKELTDQAG